MPQAIATPSRGSAAPALIVVTVPEDATVYCANRKTETTGTQRKFTVPLEQAGRDYDYPVRVEVVRNGRKYVGQSMVKVQSGKTAEVRVNNIDQGEELNLVRR